MIDVLDLSTSPWEGRDIQESPAGRLEPVSAPGGLSVTERYAV